MTHHLLVRNVEAAVVRALEAAAAAHGRTVEEEHREILRMALCQPVRRGFKEALAGMPEVGLDEDFDQR